MANDKYVEYLKYVKEYLTKNQGIESPNPLHPFRSRFQHTIRVLHWCIRLTEGVEGIDREALYTAAVFHDIGYTNRDNENHAKRSGDAFHEYAVSRQMEEGFREKVEAMIYNHSDKELLQKLDTSREMVALLEADLLDEEGAMGIVWDCMVMGNVHASSYAKAYYHIMESSNKKEPNRLVTEKGRKYWEEKKRLVSEFASVLEHDLMIGSPYFDI